jgi:hypothetical protein
MILLQGRKGQLAVILLSPMIISYAIHYVIGTYAMYLDLQGECIDLSLIPQPPNWSEAGTYAALILGLFAAGNGAEHAAQAYRYKEGKQALNEPAPEAPKLNEDELH